MAPESDDVADGADEDAEEAVAVAMDETEGISQLHIFLLLSLCVTWIFTKNLLSRRKQS